MSWVPFDPALVEEIKARMDLRAPNADGLAAVVKEVERGDGREVVCDLATGVGKTYLAAGLVDYLAAQGVRNILIVTPGTTIQNKTLDNFTPGSPKFVPGAEHLPLLITSENYSRGQVGDALHNNNVLKLFVFNVQQLIRPTAKMSRKTRKDDEFIGGPLYDHLRSVDDLVVIADEHHVYRTNAKAFGSAIRDLKPRALVGLTATPDEADRDKVVYTYSLADAIADGVVNIPVIVYREDGIKDIEIQLADACHLRERKESVWQSWAQSNDLAPVVPVLFVACQEIRDAERVANILRGDGYLPGANQVLVITSESPDKDLAALAAVESPDSPVRAVVSVDKLKEGWDVKNIGVIVGYRALASQTLTEQVLGRGLRLPFGKRVGVPAIDHVDLVAHDSYWKLLSQKDALLQQVVPRRDTAYAPAGGDTTARVPAGGQPDMSGVQEEQTQGILRLVGPARVVDGERMDGADVLQLASYEATTAQHERDQQASTKILDRAPDAPLIKFPRREREVQSLQFSLSYVENVAAQAVGAAFRHEFHVQLKRQALMAERDMAGKTVVRAQQVEEEEAFQRYVPVTDVRREIEDRILELGLVESSFPEARASERIAKQFLLGAGVTDDDDEAEWSERRTHQAVDAIGKLIVSAYNARKLNPHWGWRTVEVPIRRSMPSDIGSKWDEKFSKYRWYEGWTKAIQPIVNFDAKSTEFALAHLFDSAKSVDWWLRLYERGDQAVAYIELENGKRYYPDFVVLDNEGVYWVVEGKSDRDADRLDVLDKKRTAEEWARFARDHGDFGVWRYVFATESMIKIAKSWEELLVAAEPER